MSEDDDFQAICGECGAIYWTSEQDVSPGERAKRQCQACWYHETVYWDTKDDEL